MDAQSTDLRLGAYVREIATGRTGKIQTATSAGLYRVEYLHDGVWCEKWLRAAELAPGQEEETAQ